MVQLRTIEISEAGELAAVATRSFVEAYQETETMEELERFCAAHFNVQKIAADLQTIDCQHIGAFLEGAMVGYLKLNFGKLADGSLDAAAVQIHRIYVLRDFWQHKIGAALMAKSIEIARVRGASRIWLVVYNMNQRAQDFYKKWGFRQTGLFDFDFNGTVHQDYLLELEV